MTKSVFRCGTDGEGRVRCFVNGSEHSLDEYIAKYAKEHGVMPVIPKGIGGSGDESAPAENLKAKVEKLQAEVDALKNPPVDPPLPGGRWYQV